MRNLHNELLIALDEISKLDQEQNLYHQFTLSPYCIIDYTVLKVDDGGYEIIDREVAYNDNQYCGYDEEAVSCWEVLDMNGFIDDNFEDIGLGGSMEFTVKLSVSYHTDYYGESDVDIDVELL